MLRTIFSTALFLAASTICSASSFYFTGSGTFSNTDSTDLFVTPGATFSLTFVVPTNPALSSAQYTSLSFDVPPLLFSYRLNGTPINVGQPTEVTFDTSSDGGGVTLNFPNSVELILGSSQYFSGVTSAPTFAPGLFPSETFIFLDNNNADAAAATVQLVPTPEPSSMLLVFGGLSLVAAGFRKLVRAGACCS